jgi:hypothetical protein
VRSRSCPLPPTHPRHNTDRHKKTQIHHESRHAALPWEPEKAVNVHAETGGVTTQGVAVRGSLKKKK